MLPGCRVSQQGRVPRAAVEHPNHPASSRRGGVQVVGVVGAMLLIDRVGRRALLLVGSAVTAVAMTVPPPLPQAVRLSAVSISPRALCITTLGPLHKSHLTWNKVYCEYNNNNNNGRMTTSSQTCSSIAARSPASERAYSAVSGQGRSSRLPWQ